MWSALRYYWVVSRGYRLQPWKSPYLRWRLETYFGPAAAELNGPEFFRLLWRERERMRRFLRWAEEMRRGRQGP